MTARRNLLGVSVAALAGLPSLPSAAAPAADDAELMAMGARVTGIQREHDVITEAMRKAGPGLSPAQEALEGRSDALVEDEVRLLEAMAERPSTTAAGIRAKARAAWETWPRKACGQMVAGDRHDAHLISLLRDLLRHE